MTKTTKRQFNVFKKECLKWVTPFSLGGWTIYFAHDAEECLGSITVKVVDMIATIHFGVDWSHPNIHPPTDKNIAITAKHEMIHLLMARLVINGKCRYINIDELDESAEELTRKLEKLIKE